MTTTKQVPLKQYRINEVKGTARKVKDTLIKLHKRTLADAPLPSFDKGYWWIVYKKDKPIGFAGMQASRSVPNAIYLCRSGILPDNRGAGLQRKLIKIREAKALQLGYSSLVTDTTDNIYSANNLIREGFVLYNPKVKYAFSDSLYWRKDL